jgi:cysteinyl-tRNA synthetase
MNLAELGEQIDIHGGGNDLIFPHHENEIAQSESFTGKPFARYWIHNGMLQLGGEKMSKSIGNIISIQEFLSRYDADVLRMLVLNGSYRAPLVFTEAALESASGGLERLRSGLKPASAQAGGLEQAAAAALLTQCETTQQAFTDSMDDDFNSSGALAGLFELVRATNTARDNGATAAQLQPAQSTLRTLAGVLGLRLGERKAAAGEAERFIALLVELRTEMRKQKNWAMSDLIRDRLKELGVMIEDSKDGTTWHF